MTCWFLMLFGQNKTGIGLMIRAGNLKGDRPLWNNLPGKP